MYKPVTSFVKIGEPAKTLKNEYFTLIVAS